MWTDPSTRNAPPATKYFARKASCRVSSSCEYGSSPSGAAFPGTKRQIAATTTPQHATDVGKASDERCWTQMGRALPEPGLEEVDDQRPGQIDRDEEREDHPRA